jgi:hypothetical protein
MATGTLGLTSSWWTADDWVNPIAVFVSITGAGSVECLWEVGTPAAAASGAPIPAGVYNLYGEPGYKPYFRVTSGSATLYYAKSSATPIETTKSGFAYSGDAGADEEPRRYCRSGLTISRPGAARTPTNSKPTYQQSQPG